MSVEFDPNNKYYRFFLSQVNKRQAGGGVAIPELGEIYHFRNGLRRGNGHLVLGHVRRRRGLGIGSFLLSLFQRAKPILKTIGTKAIDVASDIAKDALSGKDIRSSAISNISEALPSSIRNLTQNTPTGSENNINKPKSVSFAVSAAKRRKLRPSKQYGRGFKTEYPGLAYLQR